MAYEKRAYLDHMAIFVKDIAWSIAFFRDVFHMSVTRVAGPPENPEQVWLDGGLQLVAAPDFHAVEGRSAHLGINVEIWTLAWKRRMLVAFVSCQRDIIGLNCRMVCRLRSCLLLQIVWTGIFLPQKSKFDICRALPGSI